MSAPTFTRRELSRLLRLRPGQLTTWEELGLLPRREPYGWRELARARALRECEAQGGDVRRVRRSLRAACARQPELTDPRAEASWRTQAGRVEVHYGGLAMEALSGQLRLPFDPPEVRVAAAPVAHESAEQWFTFGLSLEGDPELRAQAAAAYARCLELDPAFCSAHINLGTLRYHQQNYAEAEACYRAALQLDPNYALAHFNLGNVLDETGRLETAVAAYLEAVRLAPGYADAHYNLALAYQRLGLARRAVPHWQRYLGLDKASAWALHARTQLRQAIARDPLRVVS